MLVFVYGSLLAGLHNHHHLANARLVGADRTAATFQMVSLGAFPAIANVRTSGHSITGEVYEVNARTLRALDLLEGVASGLYDRTTTTLASGRQAQVYTMHHARLAALNAPRVEDGNWRRYTANRAATCRN